jgi:hypothetical protein
VLRKPGPGRPPKWCSPRCRTASALAVYQARRGAEVTAWYQEVAAGRITSPFISPEQARGWLDLAEDSSAGVVTVPGDSRTG